MIPNPTFHDPVIGNEFASFYPVQSIRVVSRYDWFKPRQGGLVFHRELQPRIKWFAGKGLQERVIVATQHVTLGDLQIVTSDTQLIAARDVSEADYQLIWDDLLSTFHQVKEDLDRLPTLELERPTEAALQAARARNAMAVATDKVRLLRESLSQDVVLRRLQVVKSQLNKWVQQGRILALRPRGTESNRYPAWQFTERGELIEGMIQVLEAAHEADMGPEVLHFFMVEPNERLGGVAPADLLARGQVAEVVRTLRTSGLGPF